MLSKGAGFQLLNMNNAINLNPSRQFIETFKTNGQSTQISIPIFPKAISILILHVPTTVDVVLSAKKGKR